MKSMLGGTMLPLAMLRPVASNQSESMRSMLRPQGLRKIPSSVRSAASLSRISLGSRSPSTAGI